MSVARFERFFRIAAGLDVDKSDLKRYSDFVSKKTPDLLVRGRVTAEANGRAIVEPFDPPITKSKDAEARLPDLVGGLSVALVRTFKIIDPDVKNPRTKHWERAFTLFDLLLASPRPAGRGSGSAPGGGSSAVRRRAGVASGSPGCPPTGA